MKKVHDIRIHGHRGWRGLYPENTIVAFTEAIKLGVDVLEMDVVLSADHELVVSHDPYMHHEICLQPDGSPITADEEERFNLYRMNLQEIQRFVVGTKPHPRFPDQKKSASHKPSLKEVIDAVQPLLTDEQRQDIHWNIEIKSRPIWDEKFHPHPDMYATIVYEDLKKTGILDFTVLQSFDARIIKALYKIDPSLKLIYLNEDKMFDAAQLTKLLGFKPYGYSPYFAYVDENLVSWCNQENILLLTWTVNEEQDIKNLLSLGVKEIITDHPELVMALAREKGVRYFLQ